MTLDFRRARQLCTERELALVASARGDELRILTPDRLRAGIARARTLRDKFRDQASRQAREARGKAPPRGTRPSRGNARTVEKAELFGEVLTRFETRAARLERARPRRSLSRVQGAIRATQGVLPQGAGRRGKAARPVRAAPSAGGSRAKPSRQRRRSSERADAARKQLKVATSQVPRVHAHVGSRNRRRQAARDSR